jgi:uncharacterized membrane protein
MTNHVAITVNRAREEVEQRWSAEQVDVGGTVSFRDAPGDRGTEIHLELERSGVQKVLGAPALARAKDELRRFKQRVETGEVARSDATPTGERFVSKFKQRPAQPLPEEAGVS